MTVLDIPLPIYLKYFKTFWLESQVTAFCELGTYITLHSKLCSSSSHFMSFLRPHDCLYFGKTAQNRCGFDVLLNKIGVALMLGLTKRV